MNKIRHFYEHATEQLHTAANAEREKSGKNPVDDEDDNDPAHMSCIETGSAKLSHAVFVDAGQNGCAAIWSLCECKNNCG